MFLKKSIFLILITYVLFYSACGTAKSNSLLAQLSFTALIVEDLDNSLKWYQDIFELEIVNNNNYPDRGFKQANLKNRVMALELIELNSALSLSEAIPDYNERTRIQGIFKIGFEIDQFDQWVLDLRKYGVEFNGEVVTLSSGKRMVVIKDLDGNRIQFFEK